MNKSVMLSINPKWCELIARKKKTIEVRKTKPKIDVPFKCYIYCTYGNALADLSNCGCKSIEEDVERGAVKRYALQEHKIKEPMYSTCAYGNGKVIGHFICDKITHYNTEFYKEEDDVYQGIREVWTDDDSDEDFEIIASNDDENLHNNKLLDESCLTIDELKKYVGYGFKKFYAWHVSDLVIYDKPRELWDFYNPCHSKEKCVGWENCNYAKVVEAEQYVPDFTGCPTKLTKPFQSWGYVEELK